MELFEPLKELLNRSWQFSLSFITAVVVFVIGWIIAKTIRSLIVKLLKVLRVDKIAEQAKIADFLSKGSVKYTLSELVAIIIYWILLLGVLVSSLNMLALTGMSGLLDRVLEYLPNVIGGLVILISGIFIAVFVGSIVRTTAANVGVNQSNLLGKVAQAAILVFTVIITLDQLKIGAVLVSAMNIVLGTIGLGLALAFGLGCKDIAARFISEVVDKMKRK